MVHPTLQKKLLSISALSVTAVLGFDFSVDVFGSFFALFPISFSQRLTAVRASDFAAFRAHIFQIMLTISCTYNVNLCASSFNVFCFLHHFLTSVSELNIFSLNYGFLLTSNSVARLNHVVIQYIYLRFASYLSHYYLSFPSCLNAWLLSRFQIINASKLLPDLQSAHRAHHSTQLRQRSTRRFAYPRIEQTSISPECWCAAHFFGKQVRSRFIATT